MTCKDLLLASHPELEPMRISDVGCPHEYGYAEKYKYCEDGPVRSPVKCSNCWARNVEEKHMIYAHIYNPHQEVDSYGVGSIDIHKNCKVADGFEEGLKNPNPAIVDAFKTMGESAVTAAEAIGAMTPHILDSGNRREFETGAVRDIQEGKGRCDLLPLDVVGEYLHDEVVDYIYNFANSGDASELYICLEAFADSIYNSNSTMLLEVSKHFEEGCKKYGENNWQKGIPVRCYIDSAVRHYLKFLRGDKDEPHDRAFCWNIICAIWTCKHMPELNEYAPEKPKEV